MRTFWSYSNCQKIERKQIVYLIANLSIEGFDKFLELGKTLIHCNVNRMNESQSDHKLNSILLKIPDWNFCNDICMANLHDTSDDTNIWHDIMVVLATTYREARASSSRTSQQYGNEGFIIREGSIEFLHSESLLVAFILKVIRNLFLWT